MHWLGFSAYLIVAVALQAQDAKNERSFSVPVSALQTALKKLPGGTSGPLPVLEGFVVAGAHSLEHYQRPYYQCRVRVTSTPSGGSLVRIAAKITAWNNDPAHSGYEVLESNGRIESDLLDRLQDSLGAQSASKTPASDIAKSAPSTSTKAEPPPEISAPVRQLPSLKGTMSSSLNTSPANPALEREAKSLAEILRNQSHPTNLVAVKQEETPVLQSPRTDATVLFLANAEDEFEILSMNPGWVYVRISGLSRGWIRRSSVVTLEDSPGLSTAALQPEQAGDNAKPGNSRLFTVSSEGVGGFPAQWAPLKGKIVRIISVQQTPGTGHVSSAKDKLEFAKLQFKQKAAPASSSAAGVVVIFDSEDGGMVAATVSALERWQTGTISDEAFWKQCYFDPPETFGSANR